MFDRFVGWLLGLMLGLVLGVGIWCGFNLWLSLVSSRWVVSVGMCCMGIVGCCGWFWFVVDWFVVR